VNRERRGAGRYELALPVRYRDGCVGVTRNISASGVLFETDRAEREGDSFVLEVELADATIRCEGRVVRIEPLGNRFGVALELTTSRFEVTLAETSLQTEKGAAIEMGVNV
jgi:hypothetical protein